MKLSTHFATLIFVLTAAVWAAFSVWLGFNPAALLSAFSVETSPPAMLTEIRAFYGGVEMGIAAAMIILWRRGDRFASLLIGGLPLAGSSAARILGMLADGYSNLHVGLAFIELLGASLCLAGCAMLRTFSDTKLDSALGDESQGTR